MMRINKFLARCGVASRRECDRLVQEGRVRVNNQTVRQLGTQIDEKNDGVKVDGNHVHLQNLVICIALNKPVGFITTTADEKGRSKVTDFIKISTRVFPIGRLDHDSEGLLLLTNDGDLSHRVLHPRFKVEKKYHVYLNRPLAEADLKKVTSGILLEDGWTQPCQASFRSLDTTDQVILALHEGRNRQIRRMFQALGYQVQRLRRIAIGPITLGNLRAGEWRYLEPPEIERLVNAQKSEQPGQRKRK